MSVTLEPSDAAISDVHRADERFRHRWMSGVPFALVTVVARLLIVRLPLTPDEGGYLLAASQWHHGTSTYGPYFVDRPPLLMAIFALADLLGGGLALRVIGLLAAAAAVVLAGRIGGRRAAATAAAFVITPLFGTTNVDGELLALPFILGGLLMLLRCTSASGRPPVRAAAWAGALATAAFLVKQDMVDVFVASGAAGAVLVLNRRGRFAAYTVGGFMAGALATGVAAVGLGWARGTSPARLWDALVSFRVQAGAVISAEGAAAGGTTERLHAMLQALAVSGAPLVALVALVAAGRPVRRFTRDRPWRFDLRWVALPVLAWESAGVLLGGSYWQHYLIALIPGLVLLLAAVPQQPSLRRARLLLLGTLVLAGLIASVTLGDVVARPPALSDDARVSAYLVAHRHLSDTAVVGFGHPNILYDARMTSPYEHLWSLSARVRDPHLDDLTEIMVGPQAPRWIVVAGASLGTWGIDATAADQVLRQRYRLATTAGDWQVFQRDGAGAEDGSLISNAAPRAAG